MYASLRILNCRKVQGTALLRSSRNLHVAIVGTGPSGFYTAKYLLDARSDIKIDFFERLPFPYGLVRYGVAPDHPEVKSVTATFEEVCGHTDRVRLFSNVTIGDAALVNKNDVVPLEELKQKYDGVVLAYGASSDHDLRIPGENLKGVLSARSFVNWYNGHPEYKNLHHESFDLSKVKHVVIVGQGNVALDCARILAKSTDELASTDIANHAISALANSAVETVTVIGRRGHVQAAFTIKEVRELTKIDGVKARVFEDELRLGMTPATVKELENNRPKKRITDLIQTIAAETTAFAASPSPDIKRFVDIRFLLNPVSVVPAIDNVNHVGALSVERTKLIGEPHAQKAVKDEEAATKESLQLPCDLLLKSVGYKSEAISASLPMDARHHTVKHEKGQVVNDASLFVVGWLKRGPSGIIGTNIVDAKETVSTMMQSLPAQSKHAATSADPWSLLQQQFPFLVNDAIDWKGVQKLDAREVQVGQAANPPKLREKLLNTEEMLQIARES